MSSSPSWQRARDDSWTLAQRSVLEDLEKQYLQLKQDRSNALEALQKEKALVTQLQAELSASRQQEVNETQMQHELAKAKQATAAAEENQKLQQERMDRLLAEADQLREEISRLNQLSASLQKELSTHQVASRLQESQAIPLLLEKNRLETELDSIQAHASWLEQELADKHKLISKLRQEHSDHTLQLQLQLDVLANEKEAAVTTHKELSKIEYRLQEKVTGLSRDLLELKQEKARLEQEHEVELTSERNLNELLKRQIDQLSHRCQSLENQNHSLQQAAEEAIVVVDKEKQELREELEAKYQALLTQQATEFRKQTTVPRLTGVAKGLFLMDSSGVGDVAGGDTMEESNHDDDEPLGLTELYTRYHEIKRELQRELKQKEHFQSLLVDLQKEIEGMAPGLVRQREEYDQAMDRMKDYQDRLKSALEERDFSNQEAQVARQEVARCHKEMKALKQESQLLAQQVQALLRKEASGTVDPNFPIDVTQMQSQNQKLLVERLQLKERVSELEGLLRTDELRTHLEVTLDEMNELKEERKKQEALTEKLVQQRDLYRALAIHSGNKFGSASDEQCALQQISQQSERATKIEQKNRELEKLLSESRASSDAWKRDRNDLEERLQRHEVHSAELTKTVSRLETELLSARGQVARAEAEAQYHKEKCDRLEETNERSRAELSQISGANSQLQRINTELHQTISKANGQCASLESEKNQSDMKIRLLEAQLQTARSSEARLTAENSNLRSEMSRQGAMVEDLRRIEACLMAKSEEETNQAVLEVDRLKMMLEREQAKNTSLIDELRGQLSVSEVRIHDLESQRAKAQEDALQLKDSLHNMLDETKEKAEKINELEAQLRSARRKLGEIADDDETKVELSLRNRISNLVNELDIAQKEIESLKKQAEHYQKIASDSDEIVAELRVAVQSLGDKSAKDKDEMQSAIDSLKKDNAAKQQVIVELTNDLSKQRGEQEKAEAILTAQIESLKTEIQVNSDDTVAAKATMAAMKLDMEKLVEERDRALSNYERELSVHSDSRTALRHAREKADQESRQRLVAEHKIAIVQAELNEKSESWKREKLALEESLKNAEENASLAREQSDLLHKQVVSLQKAFDKRIEEKDLDSASNLSSSDLDILRKSLAEAGEVVRIARSENEILRTELDKTKRLIERERAASAVIKRSLDEARAENVELQKRGEMNSNVAQIDALNERIKSLEAQGLLLTDSNSVLRESVDKLQQSLIHKQNELDEAKRALQPSENAMHDKETKIATLEAENKSLRRDLDDWKNRVQSIVSKFNQVDPVEHSQVKRRVEELAKENESLSAWKRTTEEENTRMRTIATKLKEKNMALQKELQSLKQEVSATSKANHVAELTSVSQERDELKKKNAELEKEVASKQLEATGLSTQTENLRKRLRQLLAEKQEASNNEKTLKANIASLEEQIEAVRSQQTEPEKSADAQVDSSKPELKTTPSQPIIPTVPPEGFQFGPSERPKTDEAPKGKTLPGKADTRATGTLQTEAKSAPMETPQTTEPAPSTGPSAPASFLRSSAPAFVPKAPEQAETAHPATPPSIKKELSIKEKLLEKKRKLQEVMSRKAALEKQAASESKAVVGKEAAQAVVAEDRAPSKRPKQEDVPKTTAVAKESVEDSTRVAEPVKPTQELAVAPVVESEGLAKPEPSPTEANEVAAITGDVLEEPEASEAAAAAAERILETKEDDAKENDQIVDSIEVEALEEPPAEVSSESAMPVSKSPFGGFSSGSGPPVFGQASTPAIGFGTLAASAPPGGAFLDIKPPGSSSSVPIFSFGTSPSITLPIPSQAAPAPSPFGAFGLASGGSGFTFGQSSTSLGALPLFGAPATDAMEDEQDPKDTMEDNEGEMEAEE